VIVLSLEASCFAALPAYSVTDLTGLVAPTSSVTPADIDNLNQIVGSVVLPTNARGFIYSAGTVHLLAPLPLSMYDYSAATAVNTLGQVVGFSDEGGIPKAAYWSSPTAAPQSLVTGGGPDANVYAEAINDNTTIVGFFTGSGSGNTKSWTAVKWQPEAGHPERFNFTKLDTPVVPPAGAPAGALGINAAGHIVGSGAVDPVEPLEGPLRWSPADVVTPLGMLADPPELIVSYNAVAINDSLSAVGQAVAWNGNERAVRWNSDGSIVDLEIPAGFAQSSAVDINSAGTIVGKARSPVGSSAFLNIADNWIDLNSRVVNGANWHLESAVGINNGGAIVGTGTLNGEPRAFLLSPVQVPYGDYNANGTVDAADYVVWRKTGGSLNDYNLWRSNFGAPGGGSRSSASENASVPESTATMLLVVGMLVVFTRRQTPGKKRNQCEAIAIVDLSRLLAPFSAWMSAEVHFV